ncbi:DNA-directed RNA polymerase III subunit RPC6 [Impatiens glandulifera]|uniref:DNA-directed RNA polymerase III subunit RPC6 n=1 Tax=Impatiens glandulifera TaxID=253017 RepID=UPI001FB155C5|nr:DNA-directed RNA polymerase III subunit RPC6 [Impatiens glandulifera]
MSRIRKREDPVSMAQNHETTLLTIIKSKGDMGIFKGDLKREALLSDPMINKALKMLQAKELIKEVINIRSKGRKHYMAMEFEPSKELTGGTWYSEGKLDKTFIDSLRTTCYRIISKMKVASGETISDFIKKNKITTVECTTGQVNEILRSMVLDNEIFEIKSNGMGECHSIPIGMVCYRVATGVSLNKQGGSVGAMASVPCGVCTRISKCTPDGVISPKSCAYFQKWLDF